MLSTTIAYFSLQVAALVLLPILTGTVLLVPDIQRHSTVKNYFILWIIQALSASLLLLGGFLHSRYPPHQLCQLQSAIMYGAPPALSCATLCLVGRVWYLTWSVDKQRTLGIQNRAWIKFLLVLSPYAVWLGIAVASAIIAGDDVTRFRMYCATNHQAPALISGITAAGLLIITCGLQVWTVVIVYSRYRLSRRFGPQEIGQIDPALFFRILFFSIFTVVALVLSIVSAAATWSEIAPDLMVGIMACAVFIIFASQRDVLETWRLRRRRTTLYDVEGILQSPAMSSDRPSDDPARRRHVLALGMSWRSTGSRKSGSGNQKQNATTVFDHGDVLHTLNVGADVTTLHSPVRHSPTTRVHRPKSELRSEDDDDEGLETIVFGNTTTLVRDTDSIISEKDEGEDGNRGVIERKLSFRMRPLANVPASVNSRQGG